MGCRRARRNGRLFPRPAVSPAFALGVRSGPEAAGNPRLAAGTESAPEAALRGDTRVRRRPRGGVATQRTANPCTPVRFRARPPIIHAPAAGAPSLRENRSAFRRSFGQALFVVAGRKTDNGGFATGQTIMARRALAMVSGARETGLGTLSWASRRSSRPSTRRP